MRKGQYKCIRTNPKNAPLTTAELSGVPRKIPGVPILCAKCHKSGGTLVKQRDGVYVHDDCPK